MTAPTRAGIIALIYDLKLASRRVGADPTEPRHADAETAAGRALLRYAAEACPECGGGDAGRAA